MSDQPFLQTFAAVSASAILVCGSLVLITSTAPWTPPQQAENDPSTPDTVTAANEATASIVDQAGEAPPASDQADVAEGTLPEEAEGDDTASSDGQTETEASQALDPEASLPKADDATAAAGVPLDAETGDASSHDVAADTKTAASAPESTAEIATPEVAVAEPALPSLPIASDKSEAATDQIGEMLAALPPRPITSEKSEAATMQVATVLAATPSASPSPPPPAPSAIVADDRGQTATVVVTAPVTPPPPLPLRKPTEKPSEPKDAAHATPQQAGLVRRDAAKQEVAQQEAAGPHRGTGQWQAMALAPADKPSTSLSKAPLARPTGQAYPGKVWAALARNKPRAGIRGSATVVFSIGENGALRGVQIGRSSGNARLDQLALQTVRSAAPYPPPPSGAVSYTIRIDFQ